ncbi:MAG: hypothetical protein QOD74_578, partial [Variibacter sp.]|nr:hypothetical protein [Variibacter sp.]
LLTRLARMAVRAGRLADRTVFLIGSKADVRRVLQTPKLSRAGVTIVGTGTIGDGDAMPRLVPDDVPDQDLISALDAARAQSPDAVVLAFRWAESAKIEQCIERFRALPVEIHLAEDDVLASFGKARVENFGELTTIQLVRKPLNGYEQLLKRSFDLIAATAGLLVLWPLFLVIAILIKLDSRGPVFFAQRRYGFNQKHFWVVKFRSMRTLEDGPTIRQAVQGDTRITKLGRWMRRWNIDELPQLINVIKGEMSLVGPRPHALAHNRHYEQRIATYARRHNVKPGLTGWAQVNGFRGPTETDEKMQARVAHDLYYIDNWSFWLDVNIILKTLFARKSYTNAF